MGIPDHITTNFDALLRAASDGNLALMECTVPSPVNPIRHLHYGA